MNAHKSAITLAIVIALITLIWAPEVTHAAPSPGSGWTQMTRNTAATTIYAIYSGGNNTFEMLGDTYGVVQGIYVYEGMITPVGRDSGPIPQWGQIGDGRWRNCAVNGQGQLFCINSTDGSVSTWSYANPVWKQIGWSSIALYAGGNEVYSVQSGTMDIYHYEGEIVAEGRGGMISSWARIGGPGKMFVVDGQGRLFGITPDGSAVATWSPANPVWTQIGGPAATLYAGGNELYGVQPGTGNVYHYLGSPFQWTQIGGPGKMFVVDGQGRLFGITPDGSAVAIWSPANPVWTLVSGSGYMQAIYGASPSGVIGIADNQAYTHS